MSIKTNKIIGCFKLNGDITNIELCDYVQIELLGTHAKNENSNMLVSLKSMTLINEFIWYLGKNGYPVAYKSIDGSIKSNTGIKAHRLIKNDCPKNMVVDHINRNKLDNRIENLRICTQKENSYNRTKNESAKGSKYKGVKKMNKNEWMAIITKDGVKHEMKNLPDEKTASLMYDLMAEELFGLYASKNNC